MLRLLMAAVAALFVCLMLTACDGGGNDLGTTEDGEPIVPVKPPGVSGPDRTESPQ